MSVNDREYYVRVRFPYIDVVLSDGYRPFQKRKFARRVYKFQRCPSNFHFFAFSPARSVRGSAWARLLFVRGSGLSPLSATNCTTLPVIRFDVFRRRNFWKYVAQRIGASWFVRTTEGKIAALGGIHTIVPGPFLDSHFRRPRLSQPHAYQRVPTLHSDPGHQRPSDRSLA